MQGSSQAKACPASYCGDVSFEASRINAVAPGKLILSGEHAVVYGYPALAMAVNRSVATKVFSRKENGIFFNIPDLSYQNTLDLHTLGALTNRIQLDYERFLEGNLPIRDVLKTPAELIQFTTIRVLDLFATGCSGGFGIEVHSSIPIGCGMGSSAAMILSVIRALCDYFKASITKEMILKIATDIENVQHGHSSGLDLYISHEGGCFLFCEKEKKQRPLPIIPFQIVNTGFPDSSTGECVMQASSYFMNSDMGDAFEAVTLQLDDALKNQNIKKIKKEIRNNHALLSEIKVVPEKIQQFISEIEAVGGAGKICGAGSVKGERAGIVLLVGDDCMQKVCDQYHFMIEPLQPVGQGLHVI